MSSTRICPVCLSADKVHRSRARNIFERFLKASKIFNIYRCHNCGWRGIRVRRFKIRFNLYGIVRYVLLIVITYMIVSYFVKKMLE